MTGATRLVGTWRLQSLDNGEGLPSEAADGLIVYDASGNMSAQIVSPGNGARSTEHHAYFGTYTVDAEASTVTHHRAANTASDAPVDVVRQYRFVSDDVVTLFPQGHSGVELTFRRVG